MRKLLSLILLTSIVVPLCLSVSAQVNKAPTVLPAIREWEGSTGNFTVSNGMKILVSANDEKLMAKAKIISEYFKDMLGLDVGYEVGEPDKGDIYLIRTDNQTGLGEEGYILDVQNIITITSDGYTGILYGGISVLQSLYADGYVPKGTGRDYPRYSVRSGMLDVARAYIPLEYVEEITKYMAWFKLNEINLHINDTGYGSVPVFRLESDVKGLTTKDGYYKKDEYRSYQKRMLDYGVKVITEIDTPAHSSCFASVLPDDYMLDANHLNISNPKVIEFVKELFDEYITGDDPVFVNKIVHIGTDEYPEGYDEGMRAYTNELINFINSRGYTPRFWGGFGGNGFNGNTKVSSKAQANYWADSLSDYNTLFEMGYDIINSYGPELYIVPGRNYGFKEYYNLKYMYENWQVNYMGSSESRAVDENNPQLIGASFSLWNDLYMANGGFSIFDLFDRLKGAICLISEKTWCGNQTKNISSDDFVSRYNALSKKAGLANPGRYVALPVDEKNASGSIGWPYLASIDVRLNAYGDGSSLFYGADGDFYISSNGRLGFKRESYNFVFDYDIPLYEWVNIKIFADNIKTMLIINDTFYYEAENTKASTRKDSSTFVLPVEQIGKNLDGEFKNFIVTENNIDLEQLKANSNYALNKHITVSELEVSDGRMTGPMAVDGNLDTRLSFGRKDNQWMIVDLGAEKSFNTIQISFFEHVPEYKVYVSSDNDDYKEVYHLENGTEGNKVTDTIKLEKAVTARYIKYEQLKMYYNSRYKTYYSGGISEFSVYGYDKTVYDAIIKEAYAVIGSDNSDQAKKVKSAISMLSKYLNQEDIYEPHLNALVANLNEALNVYSGKTDSEENSFVNDDTVKSESSIQKWIIPSVLFLLFTSGTAFSICYIGKRKAKKN